MVFTNSPSKKSNKRLSHPGGRASGWGRTKIYRPNKTIKTDHTTKIENKVDHYDDPISPQPLPSNDKWNSKMFNLVQ